MSVITTKAIRIDEVGPPEVMKYVDVTLSLIHISEPTRPY